MTLCARCGTYKHLVEGPKGGCVEKCSNLDCDLSG